DLGYGIERLERRDPLAELAERAGGRERDEARAARGAENALLPVDRLGAARLEVEEIVVEADAAQRDERDRAGHGGESDDDPRMPSDPRDEPHGLRPGFTSPLDMPAARDEHEGGEERHHREPGKDDRGPGDEAELPDAGEVRQHEHVERARRRERAAQHSGSRAHRGRLERLPRRAAEATLLVVAEEQVDAVVGAEADDDRDEHDREDREMTDHEGHDAE